MSRQTGVQLRQAQARARLDADHADGAGEAEQAQAQPIHLSTRPEHTRCKGRELAAFRSTRYPALVTCPRCLELCTLAELAEQDPNLD